MYHLGQPNGLTHTNQYNDVCRHAYRRQDTYADAVSAALGYL